MKAPTTTAWTLAFAALLAAALTVAACATNRPAGEQLNDAAITAKVKAKITADPEINPLNIDVDTRDGIVTLRGRVRRSEARSEAEKLARATRGVRTVVNEIEIAAPGQATESTDLPSDAWITTKIKAKLTADPQLNPLNIDVDTQDGVVTLTGLVKNPDHRAEAEKLARETKGVKAVRNQLRVKS